MIRLLRWYRDAEGRRLTETFLLGLAAGFAVGLTLGVLL